MKKNYFIHESSYCDKSAKIGKGTLVWHFCNIAKKVKIGKNCKIGQNVYIGPNVCIGNNVKIQNNVSVYPGVTLEDDVFCGPSMVFTNVVNPRSEVPRNTADFFKKTLLKKGVSIGANATVVCGVILNRYSFVGAGSVVTKNIPEYALVYGNPARIKGWICRCGEKLTFKNKHSKCKICKREYMKQKEKIVIYK